MGGEGGGLALTTFHLFNHQEGRGCVICFSIGGGGGRGRGVPIFLRKSSIQLKWAIIGFF